MVLDAKALSWAARNDIDTAKLKKAKVPIYGKWYFPEIPPDVALVNLETGEQESFRERMIAGEVMFVPAAELVRAGLAPADFVPMNVPGSVMLVEPETRAIRSLAPEPLFAMARPPGLQQEVTTVEPDPDADLPTDYPPELEGVHMPMSSICPFVLAIGFCLAFAGLIISPIIVVVGLLWMVAGAIAWIRIGLLEYRGSHVESEIEAHEAA